MSLIREIHSQRPLVRHAMFFTAAGIAVLTIAFATFSGVQKDIYFAAHQDPEDRSRFLAERDAGRPKPLAAISNVAGSLVANIGSLIGWDRDAGFDRGGETDSMQGGVHLLPQSE